MEVPKQVPCVSIFYEIKKNSSKLFESFPHMILPAEHPNKFPTPEHANNLKVNSAEIIAPPPYNDHMQGSTFLVI